MSPDGDRSAAHGTHADLQPPGSDSASRKLYPVRHNLVQHMDRATRRAWWQVDRQARSDVCEAIRKLTANFKDQHRASSSCGRQKLQQKQQQKKQQQQQQGPSTLPQGLLASCTSLTRLSCKHLQTLRSLQGLPPTLEVLQLGHCLRHVVDFTPLLACTALQSLVLQGDCNCNCNAAKLADVLGQLTSLQVLILSNIKVDWLRPEVGTALADAIGQLAGLRQLSLDRNRFMTVGARLVAPALSSLTNLNKLDLTECHLGLKGTTPFIQALPPSLTHLDLSTNSLGYEGMRALTAAAGKFESLLYLNLYDNADLTLSADAVVAHTQQLPELTIEGAQLEEFSDEYYDSDGHYYHDDSSSDDLNGLVNLNGWMSRSHR